MQIVFIRENFLWYEVLFSEVRYANELILVQLPFNKVIHKGVVLVNAISKF